MQFDDFGINAGFVEDLHAQYLQAPGSVEDHWRKYFDSRKSAGAPAPTPTNGTNGTAKAYSNGGASTNGAATSLVPAVPAREDRAAVLASRVQQLVNAYRVRGHLFARIDPLRQPS